MKRKGSCAAIGEKKQIRTRTAILKIRPIPQLNFSFAVFCSFLQIFAAGFFCRPLDIYPFSPPNESRQITVNHGESRQITLDKRGVPSAFCFCLRLLGATFGKPVAKPVSNELN